MPVFRSLIVIFLALIGSVPAASAQDAFGAIAYSPSTGAYGYSYDFPSRAAAEAGAFNDCSKHNSGCQVVLWFKNACGSLAVGANGGWGTAWAASRKLADKQAVGQCSRNDQGCRPVVFSCVTR